MDSPEKYSIRDLEKLSGIKAHTIRVWERRYGIIDPGRSGTNIRYYTNDDLRRILNISLLNRNGIKISKIAGMTDAEISRKVSSFHLVKTTDEDLVESLILSMIDLNEIQFEKILATAILRLGFEDTVLKVLFSLLKRIGTMWQIGAINPAQEHFVSNIIRQKLLVAIDGLSLETSPSPRTAILFLPEKELHELSLLFYYYALKARKIKVIYLGQSVPADSLVRIVKITHSDFLVCVATNQSLKKDFEKLLTGISEASGHKPVYLSGKAALDYKRSFPPNVRLFDDLADLLDLIQA